MEEIKEQQKKRQEVRLMEKVKIAYGGRENENIF